jgi:hypothetical protein
MEEEKNGFRPRAGKAGVTESMVKNESQQLSEIRS